MTSDRRTTAVAPNRTPTTPPARFAPRRPRRQTVTRHAVELACVLVVALVVWQQLDGAAFTGLADNGDWPRLMHQVGLGFEPADRVTFGNRLVRLLPRDDQGFDWRQYPTSTALLVRSVAHLDGTLGSRGPFDLAVLGAVYIAVLLGCVYGLLRLSRCLPSAARVTAVVAGGSLITDYAFTAYFHSLYSEPLGVLATLASVGAGLRWARQPSSLRWAALTTMALAVALTTKAQYAPTGALVGLVMLLVGLRLLRHRSRRRGVTAVIAAALLLGLAIADTTVQPQRLTRYNTWDATYVELLPYTDNKQGALRELGLEPGLAIFSTMNAYRPGTPLHDARLRREFPQPTPDRARLLAYWARHPQQVLALFWRGRDALREWRPQYLANITSAPHYPHPTLLAETAAWSGSVRALGPVTPPLVVVVLLLGLLAPLLGRRQLSPDSPSRGPLCILSLLSAAAASQYAAVLLGDGRYELVKHLLLFDLLWGTTAVGLLVWATSVLSARLTPSTR